MTDWPQHLEETAKHLAGIYSVRGARLYSLHRLHNLLTGGQYDGLLELLPEDMRQAYAEWKRRKAEKEAAA